MNNTIYTFIIQVIPFTITAMIILHVENMPYQA